MSKIIIDQKYLAQLSELDASIAVLNTAKLKLILKLLTIKVGADVFEKMAQWDIIHISVQDRQMAVQLNKLSTYMPNLMFVVIPDDPLFTFRPGEKKGGFGRNARRLKF